jgi:hypothetical protein
VGSKIKAKKVKSDSAVAKNEQLQGQKVPLIQPTSFKVGKY